MAGQKIKIFSEPFTNKIFELTFVSFLVHWFISVFQGNFRQRNA
jgi:hypothetical protein